MAHVDLCGVWCSAIEILGKEVWGCFDLSRGYEAKRGETLESEVLKLGGVCSVQLTFLFRRMMWFSTQKS